MSPASVRRAFGYLAVATLLSAAAGPVRAQVRYLVDEPGVWKPWKPFTAIASTGTDRGATPAETKAFEATLLQLNAIFRARTAA